MTATARLSDVAPGILSRMWWAVMLRGFAAIAFAFTAFLVVGKSLPDLTMAFGLYVLVDGVLSLIAAMRGGGLMARAGLALAGLVSLASSAVALWPGVTWPMLSTVIGVWCLARGGLEFANALTLRKYMERDWSLALIGVMSVLFGAMVVANPGFDPWTLVRLLSVYALVLGLLLVLLGRRFRRGLRP
jgi:uncharacterized membrane protein HdeD (DUF308 family)